MPRGNKRILLAALVLLWALATPLLAFGSVAIAAFDGVELDVVATALLIGGSGFVVAAMLYLGVGALLDRGR